MLASRLKLSVELLNPFRRIVIPEKFSLLTTSTTWAPWPQWLRVWPCGRRAIDDSHQLTSRPPAQKQALLRQQLYMFGAIIATVSIGVGTVWIMDRQAMAKLATEQAKLRPISSV